MEKLTLATIILFVTVANASAVPLINAGGGVGVWNQNPSGWVDYKSESHVDVKDDLHLSDKTKFSGWFSIEGIPLLPNIRVQYTPMKFSGKGEVKEEFSFGNITVTKSDTVESELEANQTDVTLYYGVPFLGLVTAGKLNLNAGINVKVIDAYVRVKTSTQEESKSATIPVPMLHLSGKLRPVSSISFEFLENWIGYSGSQFYETTAEIKFYPLSNPVADLFVGVGYRYQRLKIDDISDISSDLRIKGFFAEAGFLF